MKHLRLLKSAILFISLVTFSFSAFSQSTYNYLSLGLSRSPVVYLPDSLHQHIDSLQVLCYVSNTDFNNTNILMDSQFNITDTNYFQYLGYIIFDPSDSVNTIRYAYRFIYSNYARTPYPWTQIGLGVVYQYFGVLETTGLYLDSDDMTQCPSRSLMYTYYQTLSMNIFGSYFLPFPDYGPNYDSLSSYDQQVVATVMNWETNNPNPTVADYADMLNPAKVYQSDGPTSFCQNPTTYSCDCQKEAISAVNSLDTTLSQSAPFPVSSLIEQSYQSLTDPCVDKFVITVYSNDTIIGGDTVAEYQMGFYPLAAGLPTYISLTAFDGSNVYMAMGYAHSPSSIYGMQYNGSGDFSYSNGYVALNLDSLSGLLPDFSITSSGMTSLCIGDSVILTLTPTPTTSMLWSTSDTTASIKVKSAGHFTATVQAPFGCGSNTDTVIVKKFSPVRLAGNDTTICVGMLATIGGSISQGGGTAPYTISWKPTTGLSDSTISNPVASPTATTTYIITVTDSNGCSGSDTMTVTVIPTAPPYPPMDTTFGAVCSSADYSFTYSNLMAGSGGNQLEVRNTNLSMDWTRYGSPSTINVIVSPGTVDTFLVRSRDTANGCASTITSKVLVVNANPVPTVTNDTVCAGDTATLTASGGTSYMWNYADTTAIFTTSTPGTYSVTATNTSGCTATASGSVVIATPSPFVNNDTICQGGTAILNATGGTSYLWSLDAAPTATILTDSSGTYTVTVTNDFGCSATATGTVTVKSNPSVSVNNYTICAGNMATMTATGATYYLWSTGDTTATFTTSVSGTYTVTASNSLGCSVIATGFLTVNDIPHLVSGSATICSGAATTFSASGATSYIWSSGDSSATITKSSSGIYSVTATTASGCTASASDTLVVNSSPSLTVDSATVCSGSSATLTATGGSSYVWSSGDSIAIITKSTSGIYTVTALNSTGCSASANGLITVNPNPTSSIVVSVICSGSAPVLTATGGSSYLWSTGATNAFITDSISGTYTVTVTNSYGCTAIASVIDTATVSSSFTIASRSICAGDTTNLTAYGGSSYVWSTSATSSGIRTSSAGTYSVTATSMSGCTASATATVTVNTNPSASVSNDSICPGTSATLTAAGGTTYLWSNGDTAASSGFSLPGSYTVTVMNTYGCSSTGTGTVSLRSAPSPTVNSDSICNGLTATLTATGGVSYRWSTGDTATSINESTYGIYTVTATNVIGCTAVASGKVIVNFLISVYAGHDSIIATSRDVKLFADTAYRGESLPLTFAWSPGATLDDSTIIHPMATPITTTLYQLTVSDANGCKGTDSVIITLLPVIDIECRRTSWSGKF